MRLFNDPFFDLGSRNGGNKSLINTNVTFYCLKTNNILLFVFVINILLLTHTF